MAKTSPTQIRRSEMESHQFRRELFSSPSPIGEERWYYGSAYWIPCRLNDLGRCRSARQLYDRTHERKLLQLCTEAESILTPKDDSRILFLGTPQTTFTIYRKLAERNYRPFVWPSRYPRDVSKYEGLLAPQLQEDIEQGATDWEVTDPDRFDNDDLLEREASMGRSNFMLQFMLDTSLSDAEKFHLKWLTLSSLALTLNLVPIASYGAPIRPMSLGMLPRSVYLEIISTLQCKSLVNGSLTPKQSARLTRRVEEQMRQQRLLSPNETVSCTCTKCEVTETVIQTTPF